MNLSLRFPPSHAYLTQVAVGVIFHLQQVVVYILAKLPPYNPWHGCLYLLRQLLFQRSLAHRSRHPPLWMEMTHTSDELKQKYHAQLQTPAFVHWV